MNTLSKEFSILPGVIGSCISLKSVGVLFSSFPGTFTNAMIKATSENIGRMLQMAEVKGLAPHTMSINYNKFDIVAMPLNSNALVLVLCEPGSNISLVATTACMLATELENMISHPEETRKKLNR